jgi:hypothetical protein
MIRHFVEGGDAGEGAGNAVISLSHAFGFRSFVHVLTSTHHTTNTYRRLDLLSFLSDDLLGRP